MGKKHCCILVLAFWALTSDSCIIAVQGAFALEAAKKKTDNASAAPGAVSSASLSARALKELQEKNYRAALKSAEQWLSIQPDAKFAYFIKGKAQGGLGDREKAIKSMTAAIKLDPKMAIAYGERGWFLLSKKRYQEAESDFSTVVALKPSALAYSSRAAANSRLGRDRAVIADCTKSIQLDPRNAAAYELRARALFKTGPYDRCIEDWKKAIALEPKDARLREGLGLALSKTYDHEAVIEEMTKAIDSGVKTLEVYKIRADAFYKQENYKQCAEDLTVILTKFGTVDPWKRWDYLKLRARAFLRNGEYAKAEKDCTDALAVAIDDSKSYFSRADAREHMGKFKEAVKDLTQVIKLDPNDGRAFSMRAKIYEHIGEKGKADSDRKAAIRLGDKQWGI